MVFILSFSGSELLSVDASFDSSFTCNFSPFCDALQAIEVIKVKGVDMSTSSVVGYPGGYCTVPVGTAAGTVLWVLQMGTVGYCGYCRYCAVPTVPVGTAGYCGYCTS